MYFPEDQKGKTLMLAVNHQSHQRNERCMLPSTSYLNRERNTLRNKNIQWFQFYLKHTLFRVQRISGIAFIMTTVKAHHQQDSSIHCSVYRKMRWNLNNILTYVYTWSLPLKRLLISRIPSFAFTRNTKWENVHTHARSSLFADSKTHLLKIPSAITSYIPFRFLSRVFNTSVNLTLRETCFTLK